jgi:hypothetical protein
MFEQLQSGDIPVVRTRPGFTLQLPASSTPTASAAPEALRQLVNPAQSSRSAAPGPRAELSAPEAGAERDEGISCEPVAPTIEGAVAAPGPQQQVYLSPRMTPRPSAPPAQGYSLLREDEKRELPMRRALASLHRLSRLKSLMSFLIFYLSYISLSTVRMDWWTGHETLTWLEEAHEAAGVSLLTEVEEVSDITRYLEGSLSHVVAELKLICPHCEVGLTPNPGDMTFLSLEDFICSDFDSKPGIRSYPARDCAQADSTWAAHPSSLTAPCCSNATLVRASVAMMTEALAYGITELPLARLLSGGTDPSYSSTEYFVDFYIEHSHFLLQLVVSRAERMAGTGYYVGETVADAPERVTVLPGYWSFNYRDVVLETWLLGLVLLGAASTLLHDRRLMVEHFVGQATLRKAERDAGRSGGQSTLWMELVHWSRRWSVYVVLVEIPSVLVRQGCTRATRGAVSRLQPTRLRLRRLHSPRPTSSPPYLTVPSPVPRRSCRCSSSCSCPSCSYPHGPSGSCSPRCSSPSACSTRVPSFPPSTALWPSSMRRCRT